VLAMHYWIGATLEEMMIKTAIKQNENNENNGDEMEAETKEKKQRTRPTM
jgi:hypothetical protein